MAQTRTGAGSRAGRTGAANRRVDHRQTTRNNYMYDNTARRLDVTRQLQEEPRRISNETRKNREKARHMSLGYMAFLLVALCVCAGILINYIQLQAALTNGTKEIARLESTLNTLKLSNDEEYNRIVNSVDMEEVKRVAIGELGMDYAEAGQVITYSGVGTDYMRQVTEQTN